MFWLSSEPRSLLTPSSNRLESLHVLSLWATRRPISVFRTQTSVWTFLSMESVRHLKVSPAPLEQVNRRPTARRTGQMCMHASPSLPEPWQEKGDEPQFLWMFSKLCKSKNKSRGINCNFVGLVWTWNKYYTWNNFAQCCPTSEFVELFSIWRNIYTLWA